MKVYFKCDDKEPFNSIGIANALINDATLSTRALQEIAEYLITYTKYNSDDASEGE